MDSHSSATMHNFILHDQQSPTNAQHPRGEGWVARGRGRTSQAPPTPSPCIPRPSLPFTPLHGHLSASRTSVEIWHTSRPSDLQATCRTSAIISTTHNHTCTQPSTQTRSSRWRTGSAPTASAPHVAATPFTQQRMPSHCMHVRVSCVVHCNVTGRQVLHPGAAGRGAGGAFEAAERGE